MHEFPSECYDQQTALHQCCWRSHHFRFSLQKTFGKAPIPVRSGGSIPIVALFEQELGLKSVLMGFGLDSDAIHSPNEHYGIFNYFKGIETIPLFFEEFAHTF